MTVMIIGYVLLALLVVTVVIGISSVYLEHKRLLSLADGASLAAADSYTLGEVGGEGGSPSAVLGSERVRNVAADFVARSPSSASDSMGWPSRGRPAALTDPPPSWFSHAVSTRRW